MKTRPAFGDYIPNTKSKNCRRGHVYEPVRSSTGAWKTCKECSRVTYKIRKAKDPSAGSVRTMAWQQANREKYNARQRQWCKKNVHKYVAKWAYRRAAQLKRTPAWLTKGQRADMVFFYQRARKVSKETGVPHHVDHVVPLLGRSVSGLHVPWNLQIIPASENCKKGNRVQAWG